jgi:hypothetical protein
MTIQRRDALCEDSSRLFNNAKRGLRGSPHPQNCTESFLIGSVGHPIAGPRVKRESQPLPYGPLLSLPGPHYRNSLLLGVPFYWNRSNP